MQCNFGLLPRFSAFGPQRLAVGRMSGNKLLPRKVVIIMKSTTETPTVALVQWNGEAENTVKRMIQAGESVPKALVLSAPKGYISGLRSQRRSFLMQNSARLQGEIQQRGFVICGQKPVRTDRHGNERLSVEYIKQADAAVKAAETLGVPVEVLRAAVNAHMAKNATVQLPKAA
jgi:hypothetical protein